MEGDSTQPDKSMSHLLDALPTNQLAVRQMAELVRSPTGNVLEALTPFEAECRPSVDTKSAFFSVAQIFLSQQHKIDFKLSVLFKTLKVAR